MLHVADVIDPQEERAEFMAEVRFMWRSMNSGNLKMENNE